MDGQELLKSIVDLSGAALQEEDRQIRLALHERGGLGGLSHVQNERFQQYAIWKGLLPKYNARYECDGYHDIVIEFEGTSHYVELKNWREEKDGWQLQSMNSDIKKLSARQSGFLLVTSMNPLGSTEKYLNELQRVLNGVLPCDRQTSKFRTVGKGGEDVESWIAGWPVPSGLPSI